MTDKENNILSILIEKSKNNSFIEYLSLPYVITYVLTYLIK